MRYTIEKSNYFIKRNNRLAFDKLVSELKSLRDWEHTRELNRFALAILEEIKEMGVKYGSGIVNGSEDEYLYLRHKEYPELEPVFAGELLLEISENKNEVWVYYPLHDAGEVDELLFTVELELRDGQYNIFR